MSWLRSSKTASDHRPLRSQITVPNALPSQRPDPTGPDADGVYALSGDYISAYAEQLEHELPPPGVPFTDMGQAALALTKGIYGVTLLGRNGEPLATMPVSNLEAINTYNGPVTINFSVEIRY